MSVSTPSARESGRTVKHQRGFGGTWEGRRQQSEQTSRSAQQDAIASACGERILRIELYRPDVSPKTSS